MINGNNFRIIDKHGRSFNMLELGILVKSFQIDSLSPKHETEEIEGADGHIDLDTTFEGRTMSASMLMIAKDVSKFAGLRNQVFRMFATREPFLLIKDAEPSRIWKVKCESAFTPSQLANLGEFDLNFRSASPYAESLYSTQSIPPREILQTANGYWDGFEPELKYEFMEKDFLLWNDSDVLLDPRHRYMYLSIKFTGPSNQLRIQNNTTGDIFEYKGSTVAGDMIELVGIRHLKNGKSIFRDTNHKLITLEPGWNNFSVSGTTGGFQIIFDCRFYYM